MREIKFRGKRLDNGEWVHGYLLKSASTLIAVDSGLADGYWESHQVDPATVGEFVEHGGFYEGDVLYGGEEGSSLYGVVEYDEGTGRIRIWDMAGEVWFETDIYEHLYGGVKTNIHDSPEFAEGCRNE